MKHITEEYSQTTNLIECTTEEFYALSSFLLKIGVEIRICSYTGDTVVVQARNEHRELCKTFNNLNGGEIDRMADANVASGTWIR